MPKFYMGLAAVCVGLASSPLHAQTAASSAFAVNVDQTVTAAGVADVNVSVGPLAPSGGNAPPAFNDSNSVASVNQTFALTSGLVVNENLATGLLTTNSNGTALGAEATATVNNLSFGLDTSLASLITLTATTIQSFSQANSAGGLDASGMTVIEGLVLSGSAFGSLVFDGSLFVNPTPNFILFSGGGLSIILNEQILSGNGTTNIGIETNAIHIAFNQFPIGTGFKNGDVIIAHTEAFATAGLAGGIPEPATWAMMLIGFASVGISMRNRRRSVRVTYA